MEPVKLWVDGKCLVVKIPDPKIAVICRTMPGAQKRSKDECYWALPATAAAAECALETLKKYGVRSTADVSRLLAQAQQVVMAAQVKDAAELPDIPCTKSEPWMHQKRAFWFAHPMRGCMLAMGMGTGKSKVAVDLIANRDHQTSLILTPRSVIQEWPRQFRVHCGKNVLVVPLTTDRIGERGGKAKASVKERTVEAYDAIQHGRKHNTPVVIVTNYEMAWRPPFGPIIEETVTGSGQRRRIVKEKGFAVTAGFDFACLDESHRIQNASSQASRFADRMGSIVPWRTCLSGTPLSSGPVSVFGQYQFLDKGIYGHSFPSFRDLYCVMGGFEGKQIVGYQNEELLQKKFYSIAFRVESDDVLDLPPYVHTYRSFALSAPARKAYDELERELVTYVKKALSPEEKERWLKELDQMEADPGSLFSQSLEAREATEIVVQNALVKIIRLQQMTGGWAISGSAKEDRVEVRIDFGKEHLLEEVMGDIDPREPLVIVCKHTHELDWAREVVERRGRRCAELSGRRDDLARWKDKDEHDQPKRPEFDDIVVQIQAGAEGVDLTRACYHINASVGHSLFRYEQILRRTLRPGQTRPVTFIHLQAENSIDEKVYQALARKRSIVKSFLADLR